MLIDAEDFFIWVFFALMLSLPAAFVTHLVWTIKLLMGGAALAGGQVALMLIGIVLPPIGILHGYVLWFT